MRPSSHAPVVLFGLAGAISDFINKLERDLGVDGSGLTVLFCIAVVVVIVLLLLYNRSSKRRALRRAHAGSFVAPDPFARSFHLQRSKVTDPAPPDPLSVGPARDISNPRYRPDVQLPSVADPVFPSLEEIRVAALGADKGSRAADDVFVGSGSGSGGSGLGGSGLGGSGLGGSGSGSVGSNPLIPNAVGPGRLGPGIRASDELGASELGASPAFSIPGLPGLHDTGPIIPAEPTSERVSSDPVISSAGDQGPVVAPDPIGHSGFPTLSDTRQAYCPAPSAPEGAGVAVATSAPIPGWYEDPAGGHGSLRYWDGNAWTARRSA